MGHKRSYFGNLPMWSHARTPAPSEERGNPVQVGLGVDQDVALHVPRSPNVTGGIEVVTYGAPHPTYLTQEAWTAVKAKMRMALRPRMGYGFPLVWCADDSLDRVVQSGGGLTYTMTANHGWVIGDRLYFFRTVTEPASTLANMSLFGWGVVAAVPGAAIVTLDVDPSTSYYSPLAGDKVIRASSLWNPLYAQPIRPIAAQGGDSGDFYHPQITWPFAGVASTELHAVSVDLAARP